MIKINYKKKYRNTHIRRQSAKKIAETRRKARETIVAGMLRLKERKEMKDVSYIEGILLGCYQL